ncbi:MAG: hypothetical protein R3B82_11160 [Sandaracinaceae bacterium]
MAGRAGVDVGEPRRVAGVALDEVDPGLGVERLARDHRRQRSRRRLDGILDGRDVVGWRDRCGRRLGGTSTETQQRPHPEEEAPL